MGTILSFWIYEASSFVEYCSTFGNYCFTVDFWRFLSLLLSVMFLQVVDVMAFCYLKVIMYLID